MAKLLFLPHSMRAEPSPTSSPDPPTAPVRACAQAQAARHPPPPQRRGWDLNFASHSFSTGAPTAASAHPLTPASRTVCMPVGTLPVLHPAKGQPRPAWSPLQGNCPFELEALSFGYDPTQRRAYAPPRIYPPCIARMSPRAPPRTVC